MKARTKVLVTTLALGTLAFLLNGQSPLGAMLWPPSPHAPAPEGAVVPLLVAASIVEALLFGLGIAFLAWGWPLVARAGAPRSLAVAAFLAIAWMLMSWFPHDNLHMHYGENMTAIAGLTWGFHVTLGLAGAVVAAFALEVGRRAQPGAAAASRREGAARAAPGGP